MRLKVSSVAYIMAIVAIILTVAIWRWQKPEKPEPENAGGEVKGPVALVKTAPLREGISPKYYRLWFGPTRPGASQTISVSFESQIVRIMVSSDQKVALGNNLLEIKPSPDTSLHLEQAQEAYDLSKLNFKHMQGRFDLKLATNDQVLQARQTMDQAQLNLESMKKRGIGPPRTMHADVGGLINEVFVKEGAIVAAGNPLVEIVAKNRLEVRLGVEPDDLNRVKENQPVLITRVNVPALPTVTSYIRQISYGVNPTTRLVDVFLSLPAPADFLLDDSVFGENYHSRGPWAHCATPAVLPEGQGYSLFTIKGGRAVRASGEGRSP